MVRKGGIFLWVPKLLYGVHTRGHKTSVESGSAREGTCYRENYPFWPERLNKDYWILFWVSIDLYWVYTESIKNQYIVWYCTDLKLNWAEGSRWAYRIGLKPASLSASVSVSIHIFIHEYLLDQPDDHNQISSKASLGWGIGCIRFWARSDQNSGFHGNR